MAVKPVMVNGLLVAVTVVPTPVPGVKVPTPYSMFQEEAEAGSFQLSVMEVVVAEEAVRDAGFGQVGITSTVILST